MQPTLLFLGQSSTLYIGTLDRFVISYQTIDPYLALHFSALATILPHFLPFFYSMMQMSSNRTAKMAKCHPDPLYGCRVKTDRCQRSDRIVHITNDICCQRNSSSVFLSINVDGLLGNWTDLVNITLRVTGYLKKY